VETLLSVKNLSVKIRKGKNCFTAVENISFDIAAGKITGIVGESGCGKTLTALSIAGLLPPAAKAGGSILFSPSGKEQGVDLLSLSEDELCRIRGKEISMMFQEPLSSLNPLLKTGSQIVEALEIHGKNDRKQNRETAVKLMEKLMLPEPRKLMETYPSALSGGMCQRVMIAIAMISGPKLLIADEPTTALDINTQEQILKLLAEINREQGTSILFISHDLGLVSRFCGKVMVMYAGRIVEEGNVEEVFSSPGHEYTRGLLGCLPERNSKGEKLRAIPGRVPAVEEARPQGCVFAPRCARAREKCRTAFPKATVLNENHLTYCIAEGV
jgi:oligopeptide/dipeptide ABC transporter ATP-binding protein